ncbi:hypothetical protein LTS18_000104 [Coniosporium uncinatum]|uniref:Uncharacterized protein n=1 Tax=Coniosporium uncinatum TaxID=93489 RepID=A0ACC3DZS5_9PEZI|nr:hypothetical protein LTS18_000104 [Coniosporium uncinatum]
MSAPAHGSPAFKKAVKESKTLKQQPNNDEMLELYGYFKIVQKEDISKAAKPGMFDLKGKAKYSAWQKVVDAKTTPDQADKKYVEAVNKLKTKYGTQ